MAKGLSLTTILVILVGAFMLLTGIAVVTNSTEGLGGAYHDVSKAFGGKGNTADIILGVIEIIAGGLLILSRFVSIGSLDSLLRVAIFIFWIVVMVLSLVLGGAIENIDTLGWWISLVNHSIILVILWMIKE